MLWSDTRSPSAATKLEIDPALYLSTRCAMPQLATYAYLSHWIHQVGPIGACSSRTASHLAPQRQAAPADVQFWRQWATAQVRPGGAWSLLTGGACRLQPYETGSVSVVELLETIRAPLLRMKLHSEAEYRLVDTELCATPSHLRVST